MDDTKVSRVWVLYRDWLYQEKISMKFGESEVGWRFYRRSIPPTGSSNFALPNFFEIFSRYSQSLYKTHTRETLFSSLPIGNFQPNFDSSKGTPYPPRRKRILVLLCHCKATQPCHKFSPHNLSVQRISSILFGRGIYYSTHQVEKEYC